MADEQDRDKLIDEFEQKLREMGLDPSKMKDALTDAVKQMMDEPKRLSDTEAMVIAKMVDAVVPSAFVVIYDAGDAISGFGNLPEREQALVVWGYALMSLAQMPDLKGDIIKLASMGHKHTVIGEVINLGPSTATH